MISAHADGVELSSAAMERPASSSEDVAVVSRREQLGCSCCTRLAGLEVHGRTSPTAGTTSTCKL